MENRPSQPSQEELVAQSEAIAARAMAIMDTDPSLPFISAYVMASDLHQADRAMGWLREGKYPWSMAEAFTGSYGRLDLRVRAHAEGLISDEQALEDLPSTWSGSDPDDTDPRFLALWKSAVKAEKASRAQPQRHVYLRDGKRLPIGSPLVIYRGQDSGAPFGIAWSLDAMVARKFANGAATRQHNRGGVVYVATVPRTKVLGYMTGRHEEEVIIDPASIINVEVWR